jgi:hypothetical protein
MRSTVTETEIVSDLHFGHPTYSTEQIRQVLQRCGGDEGRADGWLANDAEYLARTASADRLRGDLLKARTRLAQNASQAILCWVLREHPATRAVALQRSAEGQPLLVLAYVGDGRTEVWRSGTDVDDEIAGLVNDLGLENLTTAWSWSTAVDEGPEPGAMTLVL